MAGASLPTRDRPSCCCGGGIEVEMGCVAVTKVRGMVMDHGHVCAQGRKREWTVLGSMLPQKDITSILCCGLFVVRFRRPACCQFPFCVWWICGFSTGPTASPTLHCLIRFQTKAESRPSKPKNLAMSHTEVCHAKPSLYFIACSFSNGALILRI
jgi:hypothetical protein